MRKGSKTKRRKIYRKMLREEKRKEKKDDGRKEKEERDWRCYFNSNYMINPNYTFRYLCRLSINLSVLTFAL